jgi:hypothetical protein
MMKDRRNHRRPYYKRSADTEYLITMALTFATGGMLGACITLAVML